MNVSQRFHNNTYAPGIATYGIQGKPGEQGEPGTSMFFTDYIIETSAGFPGFVNKITSRKLPLKISDTVLDRKYINGDQFVTPNGKIYRLTNIDGLINININTETVSAVYTDYLTYIGEFNKDNNIFVQENNSNIKLNKLIITDSDKKTGSGLLTINRTNKINGSVSFINLNAIYGNQANVDLDIQYDNTLRAFVFKSQYPVVLDANTFVKYEGNLNRLSEYSPVMTETMPITYFSGICSGIEYNINASIYKYTHKNNKTVYFGCLYEIELIDKSTEDKHIPILNNYLMDTSVSIHYQNRQFQDFQLYRNSENTYYFKQDYDIVKSNQLLNMLQTTELNNIKVSLIDGIEIYLTKNNTTIQGYN